MNDGPKLQDPQVLSDFGDAVTEIANYIADYQKRADGSVQFPPVKFGQDAKSTDVPWGLYQHFSERMGEIDGNVTTLVKELNLIASVAYEIKKKYEATADHEMVGLDEIKAMLGITADS